MTGGSGVAVGGSARAATAAMGLLVALVGVAPATASEADDPATSARADVVQRDQAVVVRVVDGDTIDVRLSSGTRVSVRLLGIDTPEVFSTPECWGAEASRAAKRLLPRGSRVRLTSDTSQADRDRYGRLLRYVSKGRTDVNRRLVARGDAEVYVYNNNPFLRTQNYRRAERRAQSNNVGLWGSCVGSMPTLTQTPTTAPSDDLASYSPVSTYNCPTNAPIKGNESSMIYHPVDSPWYAITTPEQCFASEAGAVSHGFRRAQY